MSNEHSESSRRNLFRELLFSAILLVLLVVATI